MKTLYPKKHVSKQLIWWETEKICSTKLFFYLQKTYINTILNHIERILTGYCDTDIAPIKML